MATDGRDPAERLADHAAIDALADDLLPALMAKLGASGLGEIEVREGDWRVRLRRPADGSGASSRRSGERSGRAAGGTSSSSVRPALMPVGPGRLGGADDGDGRAVAGGAVTSDVDVAAEDGPGGRVRDPFRAMATSPAVGFYQARDGVVAGSRVRAGDPIAAVDVLGIPTEVVAPADGIVGASLVEPGEAVEYGQELVWIELLSSAAPSGDPAAAPSEP
jgi:biotin carboxyl carrier protein